MASTVFHFFHQLHNDGVAKLFEGSEHFIRDFIYVNDVVAVNLFFFNNPEKSGIFNCGTGNAASFTSIATTLIELENKGVIQSTPFPDALKGKYQAFTQADTTALRAIGFEKTFTPLAEGIRSYYDFLANNDGFLRRTQIAH
jgi:ADP-L-glycero-D-manno-heptose 6-epimerase